MTASGFTQVIALTLAIGLFGARDAGAQTTQRQLQSLALFEQYAGEPVDRVSNFRISDWRPLGPAHVAVFRTASKAWLLDLRTPCIGLEYAHTIALRSSIGSITARFDRIEFRDGIGPTARLERCTIERIRPVDYTAVRREESRERKERAAAASGN